jgi:hypothetical protein
MERQEFEKMREGCKYFNKGKCIYFGIAKEIGIYKLGVCFQEECPLLIYIYYKGYVYRKVAPNEQIRRGALMEFIGQKPIPIARPEYTVGKTPSDFSNQRTFYNLVQ